MSFADCLNQFEPVGGAMHLMHSTAVDHGARIIVEGELHTRACTVYGEELVYLFYGRPAYKPLPDVGPSGIDEHLPICMVIDPALIDDAIRGSGSGRIRLARNCRERPPRLGPPPYRCLCQDHRRGARD